MKDSTLRDAFSEPVESTASPACPGDETIWKAANGELDPSALGPVIDHTAGCASCAESWRMARELGEELPVQATVLPFHRRQAVWGLAAIAAGILIVSLFLPSMFEPTPTVPADEFRRPSSVALESLIDEAVPMARDAAVLRWSGGPAWTLYTVELADENLEVLARSAQLDQTEYRIPPETLADLPAGATVYWRIEAVFPDAPRVSSSGFLFRLQ